MQIQNSEQIVVGLVLWLPTAMVVPKGQNLDPYALAKNHPYVCTARCREACTSQWLFLTSDEFRADAGCVIRPEQKSGTVQWVSRPSYFKLNTQVLLDDTNVIKFSAADTAPRWNTVSDLSCLNNWGVKIFDPFIGLPDPPPPKSTLPKLNVNAPAFVPRPK